MRAVFFVSLICYASFLSCNEKPNSSHFVSFVIPCYNCENTVEESIASIYQQELRVPFEVVCLDDGSTDQTRAVLEKCAEQFPNLSIFFHEKNQGGGAARNSGTLHSHGDLIFNLDSDNILIPNSVGRLIDLIDQTGYDVAAFHHANTFSGSKHLGSPRWIYDFEDHVLDLHQFILKGDVAVCCQGNYLYTRKCFDLVGGYAADCGAWDTYEFGLAVLAAGCKIAILSDPNVFYCHRLHAGSYYLREAANNTASLQKALNHHSEVFADSLLDILANPNRAAECLQRWNSVSLQLTPASILDSLFKGWQHKKEGRYKEAAAAFAQAIQNGCKSEKIKKQWQEMSN